MYFQKTDTVAAKHVMVGDYLYNSNALVPSFSAVRVNSIVYRESNVIIETSVWTTYKHPEEGVAIMRLRDDVRSSQL